MEEQGRIIMLPRRAYNNLQQSIIVLAEITVLKYYTLMIMKCLVILIMRNIFVHVQMRLVDSTLYIQGACPAVLLFFVSNTDIVERLCTSGLVIHDILHSIEPLVKPAIKLTISNCPPYLSDDDLKPYIEKHGKIVSPVRLMSTNFKRDDLKHIYCFRRQVSILPHDRNTIVNVRESIVSNGVYHSVFFSTGGIVCFKCNLRGHRAIDCNNVKVSTDNRDSGVTLKNNTQIVADVVVTLTANATEDSGSPQITNLGESSSEAKKRRIGAVSEHRTVNYGSETTTESAHVTAASDELHSSIMDTVCEISTVNQRSIFDCVEVSMNTDNEGITDIVLNSDCDVTADCNDELSICSDLSYVSEISLNESQDMSQQGQGLSMTPPTKKDVLDFLCK